MEDGKKKFIIEETTKKLMILDEDSLQLISIGTELLHRRDNMDKKKKIEDKKAGQKAREMEREQITIRLPKELKEQLQQEANRKGISFNAYILLLIDKGHQYLH